jgi:hypothetical protein
MDARVAAEMLQLFAGLRGLIKDVPIRIAIQCASSNGPVGEDPIRGRGCERHLHVRFSSAEKLFVSFSRKKIDPVSCREFPPAPCCGLYNRFCIVRTSLAHRFETVGLE